MKRSPTDRRKLRRNVQRRRIERIMEYEAELLEIIEHNRGPLVRKGACDAISRRDASRD